jgi:hypothetical protein
MVALASLLASAGANAQITVGTPGGAGCFPFTCVDDGFEYQQVYSANAFSTSVRINSLTFYLYVANPGTFANQTFTLHLSTTTKSVDGLSSSLASNVGLDNQLFSSVFEGGAIPASFTIPGIPFFYNPLMGNLLVDILVLGTNSHPNCGTSPTTSTCGYLQTANPAFGQLILMSRAFDGNYVQNSSTFVNSTDNVGLITTFGVAESTVPEPSTLALLSTGLFGVAVAYGLKRRRSSSL